MSLIEDAHSSNNLAIAIHKRFAELDGVEDLPTISRESMP